MTSYFSRHLLSSNLSSDKSISPLASSLYFISVMILILSTYLLFDEIIAATLIGTIVAVSLCLIFPKLWIYGVLLSSYFFYAKTANEDSSQPIIFAIAYHFSLFVWIFSHGILKKQRLIKHWLDLMFVVFLGFLALNGILAVSNDVEFISWLKGWQLYLIVLYYFPIREIFTDKKSQQFLLLFCAIALAIQGISNIYQYRMALSNFKFASQLLYVGIRQGAAVFAVASLITLLGVLFTKKPILRFSLLGFHIFCFAVLMVSLARTAWVGYVFGIIVIAFTIRGVYRTQFIIGSLSIGIVLVVGGLLFFGRYADIALNVVNQRFSSSAKFSTDQSYLSRIYENEVLFQGISDFPLGGEGLQKAHNRYDAISRFSVVNTYAHNNYLGSIQKMGIPLAILFFGIILALSLRNWRIARTSTNSRELFFSFSSLAGMSSLLVINFVGSVFDQREGVFLLAILFAFSYIARPELFYPTKFFHNIDDSL